MNTSPGSILYKSPTTSTNGMRKSFGPDGCQAVIDGARCGETKNLQIIKEFRRLYEDKMKQIDDIAGGDCIQAKVNLQQEWIRDLTDQNEMLVRVVEELEVEAAERVTLLEKKLQQSSKSAGEKEDVLKEKDRQIKELETQLKSCLQGGKDDFDTLKKEYKDLEQAGQEKEYEKQKLGAEIQKTKDELGKTKEELEKTKEELQKTKEELQKTKEIMEKSEKEMQKAKEEMEKSEKEMQKAKEELQKTKEELQRTKEEMQKADGEVQKTKEEKQKSDGEKQKTKEEMRKAKEEAEKAKEQMGKAKEEMEKAKEEMEKAKEDARRQIAEMKERADAIAQERDQLKKDLDNAQEELQKYHTNKITEDKTLKETLKSKDEELRKIKGENESLTKEVDDLKGLLKKCLYENQQLEDRTDKMINDLKEQLQAVTNELEGIKDAQCADAADLKQELDEMIEQKRKDDEETQAKLNDLNTELAVLNKEKEHTLEELEKLEKVHNAQISSVQNDMLKELDNIENQHRDTLAQLEQLRLELEKTKVEHKVCMDKMKVMGDENSKLKEQEEQLQLELEKEKMEHKLCTDQITAMNTENPKLKEQGEQLLSELEKTKTDHKLCMEEMKGMGDQNAKLKEQGEQLQSELEKMKSEHKSCMEKIIVMGDENAKLKEQVQQQLLELERTKMEYKSCMEKITHMTDENEKLKGPGEQQRIDLEKAKTELKSCMDKIKEMGDENAKLKESGEQLRSELEKTKMEHKLCEEKIKVIDAENAKLKEQGQKLVSELEKMKTDHKLCMDEMKGMGDQNAKLKEQGQQQLLELERTKMENKSCVEKIKEMGEKNAKLKEQIQQQLLELERTKMEHKLGQEKIKEMDEEYAKLKGPMGQLQLDLEKAKMEQKSCMEKIEAINAENTKLKEQVQHLPSELEKTKQEHESGKEKIKKMDDENSKLKGQVEQLLSELDRTKLEHGLSKEKIKVMDEENAKLKGPAEELLAELEKSRLEHKICMEKMKVLDAEYAKSKGPAEQMKLESERTKMEHKLCLEKIKVMDAETTKLKEQVEELLSELERIKREHKLGKEKIKEMDDEKAKSKGPAEQLLLELEKAKMEHKLCMERMKVMDAEYAKAKRPSEQMLVESERTKMEHKLCLEKIKDIDAENAKLKEQVQQQLLELERLKTEQKFSKMKIKEMDEKNGKSNGPAEELLLELERAKMEHKLCMEKMKAMDAEYAKSKGSTGRLSFESEKTKMEHKICLEKVKVMDAENTRLKEKAERLRLELEKTKKEHESCKEKIKTLNAQIEKLKKERVRSKSHCKSMDGIQTIDSEAEKSDTSLKKVLSACEQNAANKAASKSNLKLSEFPSTPSLVASGSKMSALGAASTESLSKRQPSIPCGKGSVSAVVSTEPKPTAVSSKSNLKHQNTSSKPAAISTDSNQKSQKTSSSTCCDTNDTKKSAFAAVSTEPKPKPQEDTSSSNNGADASTNTDISWGGILTCEEFVSVAVNTTSIGLQDLSPGPREHPLTSCSGVRCLPKYCPNYRSKDRQFPMDVFTCANSYVDTERSRRDQEEAMQVLELLGPKTVGQPCECERNRRPLRQMTHRKTELYAVPPRVEFCDVIDDIPPHKPVDAGKVRAERDMSESSDSSPRTCDYRRLVQEALSTDLIDADESDIMLECIPPGSYPIDYARIQECNLLKIAKSSPIKGRRNEVQARRDMSPPVLTMHPTDKLSQGGYCKTMPLKCSMPHKSSRKQTCASSVTTNTLPAALQDAKCGTCAQNFCSVHCQTIVRKEDASVVARPPEPKLFATKTQVIGVTASVFSTEKGTSMDTSRKINTTVHGVERIESTTSDSDSTFDTYSDDSYEDTVLSQQRDQVLYVRRQCSPTDDLQTVVNDLNLTVSRIMQVSPEVEAKQKIAQLEEQLRAALKQKEQAVEYERCRRTQEVENLKLTIQHMENAIKNKQANSENLQSAFIQSLKEEINRLKYESHADSIKIVGLKNDIAFYMSQALDIKNIMKHILGIGDCENQVCNTESSEDLVITAQEVERFVQALQSQVNLMLASLDREQKMNEVNTGRIEELQNILNIKNMELSRSIELYQDLKHKLESSAERNKKLEDSVIELQEQLTDTELDQQFQEQKVDLCHDELDICLSNLNCVKMKLRMQCQMMTQKIEELTELKSDFKTQNSNLEMYKRDLECTKSMYQEEVLELKRVIRELNEKLESSDIKVEELNDELKNVQEIIVNMTQRESKLQEEIAIKDQDFSNKAQVWKVKEARLLDQVSQLEQQLRAVHNELAGRTHQIDSAKNKLQQISNDAQMRVQMGQEELIAAKNEVNCLRQVHEKLQMENQGLQQTCHCLKGALAQHDNMNVTIKKQLDKCMNDLKRIESDKYFVEQKNEKLLQEIEKMQAMLRVRCENVMCLEEELNETKTDRDDLRKESHHVVCNVRAWLEEQKKLNDQLKDKLLKKNALIIKYQQPSTSKITLGVKKPLPPVCAEACNRRQRGGTVATRILNAHGNIKSSGLWSLNSRGSDSDSPRSSICSDSADWFDMNTSETTAPYDEPGTEIWIQKVESMTEELERSNRYWKKKISDSEFMVTKDQ